MLIGKYSFGVGDRFGHQGKAQLAALLKAREQGVEVVPVWNKSNREHMTVHTEPASLRAEADAAVKALGYTGEYRIDADHIGLKTVDGFLASSDFFTIDVADFIGKAAPQADIDKFVASMEKYVGTIEIPGVGAPLKVTKELIADVAGKFLYAAQEAGKVYRHIAATKGADGFIPEISMDETDSPQTPVEMFVILACIAQEKVPIQTIAPKFTGRFNKGVDYVGDLAQFSREFEDDLAVIAFSIKTFGLPANLKLSVHSGSDKFSIYAPIRAALEKTGAGLHIKTAGTTWLEEVIGLAEAGGEGLAVAKEIYTRALGRFDELAKPYATVIDIDPAKLPSAETVAKWDSKAYVDALRHDQKNPAYNKSFRQLIHVGYKVAYKLGERYINALEKFEDVIARNVTENIYDRHLKPLFVGMKTK